MIETPLTEEALRAAQQRFEDFIAVHEAEDDVSEPFAVLRESLGITDEIMRQYTDWADAVVFHVEPSTEAATLFGLMVGLIAADHG